MCVQCLIWLFFCSSLTSCFPGMLLMYCLSDFETVQVVPVITGITFAFTSHMRWISVMRSSYFKISRLLEHISVFFLFFFLLLYYLNHHRYVFSPRRPCRIPISNAHIPECHLPVLYIIPARHGTHVNRTQHPKPTISASGFLQPNWSVWSPIYLVSPGLCVHMAPLPWTYVTLRPRMWSGSSPVFVRETKPSPYYVTVKLKLQIATSERLQIHQL